MKIALCFIISYDHILNQENIWREWINYNKDIINVYFFYKDITKIKSSWILKNVIPKEYICGTTYYNVVPAYISLLRYAHTHDKNNKWFCFLTDSCCPIISPKKFRHLFYNDYNRTILSWKYAWWNIYLVKRANLAALPEEYRLGNDPYFILNREDAYFCIHFYKLQIAKIIIDGGVANESYFAIALTYYNKISNVICSSTHMTDWTRMTSPTSPYLFNEDTEINRTFIENNKQNKYNIFIRKVSPLFPDHLLKYYIYDYSQNVDKNLNFIITTYYLNILIRNMGLFTLFSLFSSLIISYFIYELLYL